MNQQRLSWPELEALRDMQGHPYLVDQFYEGVFAEMTRLGTAMYCDPDPDKARRGEYSARWRLLMELISRQTAFMQGLLREMQPEEMDS